MDVLSWSLVLPHSLWKKLKSKSWIPTTRQLLREFRNYTHSFLLEDYQARPSSILDNCPFLLWYAISQKIPSIFMHSVCSKVTAIPSPGLPRSTTSASPTTFHFHYSFSKLHLQKTWTRSCSSRESLTTGNRNSGSRSAASNHWPTLGLNLIMLYFLFKK